ncbi:MAG: DUF2177 family protein [Syntrophales bacterium LBB04]|nr:DUF2177 family protein [Syntrophales bacterium LBB04]
MMKFFYLYLLTIPIFFGIDMIWLGFVARGFYRNQLGHLLRPDVNWTAAILFYLLYIVGILIFATNPALAINSPRQAVLLGGLFGFFAYTTYDLTNLATLKDWPIMVVWVDILWGVFLTASVAVASFFIGRWLLP